MRMEDVRVRIIDMFVTSYTYVMSTYLSIQEHRSKSASKNLHQSVCNLIPTYIFVIRHTQQIRVSFDV